MARSPVAFAVAILAPALALAESAATRPANIDPALWRVLTDVDARAAKVADLSANFTQDKVTPLLRKPLVSRGTLRVKGNAMLWDTRSPQPTLMRIDEVEVRIYYPDQSVLEIYPIDRNLGSLAASPLPRLDVLLKYFSVARVNPADAFPEARNHSGRLALELTPTAPALAEHLTRVRVLLDVGTALIMRAELTDPDGDRTTLAFSDVKLNTGLTEQDVRLDPPPGVRVTRPLDAVGGAPKGQRRQ